jgi:hypothetical protein
MSCRLYLSLRQPGVARRGAAPLFPAGGTLRGQKEGADGGTRLAVSGCPGFCYPKIITPVLGRIRDTLVTVRPASSHHFLPRTTKLRAVTIGARKSLHQGPGSIASLRRKGGSIGWRQIFDQINISSIPRSVSSRLQYSPGLPVRSSVTKKSWLKNLMIFLARS